MISLVVDLGSPSVLATSLTPPFGALEGKEMQDVANFFHHVLHRPSWPFLYFQYRGPSLERQESCSMIPNARIDCPVCGMVYSSKGSSLLNKARTLATLDIRPSHFRVQRIPPIPEPMRIVASTGRHLLCQAMPHTIKGRLGAAGQVEFAQNATQMMLDRRLADDQRPRDLFIALAPCHQGQHLALALG